MIRKAVLRKWVQMQIWPHVRDFHMYERLDLVRICRPLLHGIVFEPSQWDDDFYVTCFVQFLPGRKDYLAIGFGERMRRYDVPGQSYRVEPAEEEAAKLLDAMRQSPYSPFNLQPTCGRMIELAGDEKHGEHNYFGLGTCAIFENDPGLAQHFFSLAKEAIGTPEYDWDTKLLNEILELEGTLDDLPATQLKLRRWVEESIRLLGMEKFG